MLKAFDKNGKEVKLGDIITDFRGDKAIFQYATRKSLNNISGKVVVKWNSEQGYGKEYYDKVFDLYVMEVDGERERKYNFVKFELAEVVKAYTNIESLEYIQAESEEYIYAKYKNGYSKRICITADSIRAIALDAIRELN